MKSFTVIISIYNSAMDFIVTCIGSKPYRFKIETTIGEPLRESNLFYATCKSFKIFNCSTKWFELCPVRDDYYPFGMDIANTITGTKNMYLYNNPQFQPFYPEKGPFRTLTSLVKWISHSFELNK